MVANAFAFTPTEPGSLITDHTSEEPVRFIVDAAGALVPLPEEDPTPPPRGRGL